jgi:hypothetical protein
MSDGKSFLECREQIEIGAKQIKEIAPDAKSISFIERLEIRHENSTAIIIMARRGANTTLIEQDLVAPRDEVGPKRSSAGASGTLVGAKSRRS